LYVQLGIRAKQHPSGIEEIHIRPGQGGLQGPVNDRPVPAGDATDNVLDPGRTLEAGGLPGADLEAGETVKQIRPFPGCLPPAIVYTSPLLLTVVPKVPSDRRTVGTWA